MLVKNDEKEVINTTWAHRVGKLWHYIVDTRRMQLKYILYVENDILYYVYPDDIESIGDSILIKNSTRETPEDVDEYTRIYPTAKIIDKNGKNYGDVEYIKIDDLCFNTLIGNGVKANVEDIIKTSNEYTMVIKVEELTPAPTSSEMSFKYSWLIGKTATRTIYACHNTPVVVSGEVVRYDNVVSAILNCKLIELMNSVK